MKLSNVTKLVAISFLTLSMFNSCAVPSVSNSKEIRSISKIPPVKGFVEFPELSLSPSLTKRGTSQNPNGYGTKAVFGDIAANTTISIIYPSDHLTTPNKTIATGLTDTNNRFSINPSTDFNPVMGDKFVLEAARRLGGSGNNLMSIRTYIKWNGAAWESITTPAIYINEKTTALAIIEESNSLVTPDNTINKIDVSSGTSVLSPVGTITVQNILDVASLVTTVLSDNRDPLVSVKYNVDENSYFISQNYNVGKVIQFRDCSSCSFIQADLSGLNLASSSLANSDFTNANLIGSNFSLATLTGANFTGANLSGADLSSSTLTGANLTGATINGTNFSGALWTDGVKVCATGSVGQCN